MEYPEMADLIRVASDELRATSVAVLQWIRAWTPHSRAVTTVFGIAWLAFVIVCGFTGGTVLFVMTAVVVIAAVHLVRGEWRRPGRSNPVALCDNAREHICTLVFRHSDGRWYLPDCITVGLNPADFTDLSDHFDINEVITHLTAEAVDVTRRYSADTPSGMLPLVEIVSNPKVRARHYALRGSTHPMSDHPVEPTRAYGDQTSHHPSDGQVATTLIPDSPGRGPTLVGPDRRAHRVVGTEITVGRGTYCDITISADTSISRHHLTLRSNDGVWWCADNSKTGTWINGVRVTPGRWTELADGDRIAFGTTSGTNTATFYRTGAHAAR